MIIILFFKYYSKIKDEVKYVIINALNIIHSILSSKEMTFFTGLPALTAALSMVLKSFKS